ncbi:RNA-binding motif protein, X-linked 2 isoform X2 [Balaenoptera musculus]|uniref:RNA-binding motif protein, X-linked 2 isoform X2 n=1 Tax=Balaenoptera musculus TaxID=9771 RepID=A0A8B8WFI1_BALMU|nr:RNA-binding motif protein, X-linked 2 isoform X2 [Balaenoptera musculus]
MNPLTKVKLINELNEREVQLGVAEKVSWHSEYKDSAWIFLGGLPYELTEGDIICVFSQLEANGKPIFSNSRPEVNQKLGEIRSNAYSI